MQQLEKHISEGVCICVLIVGIEKCFWLVKDDKRSQKVHIHSIVTICEY